MIIERISEHQIRCTLTRDDLRERQLKLSELAYGTDKAKLLFRDMMMQAAYEFGFEADNIPLMIEAIPMAGESVTLIITKVEDPEELDTRFSKFAPSVHDDSFDLEEIIETLSAGADEVVEFFKKLQNSRQLPEYAGDDLREISATSVDGDTVSLSQNLIRIYSFESLDTVIRLSRVLEAGYTAPSSLYRRKEDGCFMLVLGKGSLTPAAFNKVCNVMSEYGVAEKAVPASEAYFSEHYEPIISDTAIQSLAQI